MSKEVVNRMKFKKTLNVTAEEFFEVLEDSLKNDIEKYGMKKKGTYSLEKGFVYKKTFKRGKNKYQAHIRLEEFERPKTYQVAIEVDGKVYQLSYRIEETGQKIDVFYQEETRDEKGDINTTFLGNILGRLKMNEEKRKLKIMENYILKNRELKKEILE